jgi:hypothetical protein
MQDLPSPYRERIEAIPTRLTLSKEQIDDSIEGARAGLLSLPQLQEYLRARYHAP